MIKKLFSPELKVFELFGVFDLSTPIECSLLPLQSAGGAERVLPLPLIIYHKPSRTKPEYEGVASEFDHLGHWYAGVIENAVVRKRPIAFTRAKTGNMNV